MNEAEIRAEIHRVESWMIGYCWDNGVVFHPESEACIYLGWLRRQLPKPVHPWSLPPYNAIITG